MKLAKTRSDLLLLLTTEVEHGVSEFAGLVCYRHDGSRDNGGLFHAPGAVLSPTWKHSTGRYDVFADLHVRARLDPTGCINNGRPYAWRYEYHQPLAVDLDRASAMTGFLRRTGRRVAELDTELGYPTDLGAYIARFAAVLGVAVFATRVSEPRPDGDPWDWLDADGMRAWIARHCEPPPR